MKTALTLRYAHTYSQPMLKCLCFNGKIIK